MLFRGVVPDETLTHPHTTADLKAGAAATDGNGTAPSALDCHFKTYHPMECDLLTQRN